MNRHLPAACSSFILILTFTACKKSPANGSTRTTTDSFKVVVNNGYGSGTYKTGDTVHIFTSHYSTNQLFDIWSGDVSILNARDEWHTWFIMPAKNVNVTGSVKNITPFTLQYEPIRGKDRLKPVYYYFPPGHKGIVYLLHGTNGNAANMAGDYEWQQLIKVLVNDDFAVVITEAEEATTGKDANADGKLRWYLLPADTVANVDYANIRIITDTFYNRGITDRSRPRYSIGMSDGGFFSATLSYMYHFAAGVQYCSQGSLGVMQITTIPTQFCMMANDNNSSVGAAGNAEALSNFNSLNKRGICSKYYLNGRSPVYPERFARSGAISTTQSVSIFNELKSKGYIDDNNFYIGYSDLFLNAIQSNPASFPVIKSLTPGQQLFVLEQINTSVADHHIYSDYDKATVRFLNNQCE